MVHVLSVIINVYIDQISSEDDVKAPERQSESDGTSGR